MAANGTLAPTVVPMVNGGQASIAISNTSPNLFTVPGDRIIAVNSLDGALTNNEQTASGGVVVATVNKKPFTFILETERGLNLSIQAVPREGAGRTIQLVSDLRGTGEEAGAWETSTSYESLLPVPPSAESHLNGFNTDQMLKQLGNLNPQQFMSGSQGGGNDGK